MRPSRSNSNLTGALTPIQLAYCKKITEKIWNYPISIYFHKEVDPVQDCCPDYLEKIKKPMDLKKVKDKLESGQYPNVERWKEDMNQIWKNAMTYNGPKEPYHLIAAELMGVFKRESESIPKTDVEAWVLKVRKAHKRLMDLAEVRVDGFRKAQPQQRPRITLKVSKAPAN